MLAEPPDPTTEIADTIGTFATVLEHAPVRDVETVLAFLALNMLRRVEEGHIAAANADRLFTLVDVQLTDHGRLGDLSAEATELLLESHHFHHWGEPLGPDPTEMRRLASAILARQRDHEPPGVG